MASTSKKRNGKTADDIVQQTGKPLTDRLPASPLATTSLRLREPTELAWSGYDSLDRTTRDVVQEATREIQQRLKRTLRDVYYIGKRLNKVREILIPVRGAFSTWVQEEFEVKYGLTIRLSEHWMNIARRFSEKQLEKFVDLKLPLSALYQLAAPSTPDGTADKIIDTVENTFPYVRYRKVPRTLIMQLVQEHKEAEGALKNIRSKEAGVMSEAQGMLLSTPVAEDANQTYGSGQFEPKAQSKIAENLSIGKVEVQQASRQFEVESSFSDVLSPRQWEMQTVADPLPVSLDWRQSCLAEFKSSRGLQVQFSSQVADYSATWQMLIQQVPGESIDFCFVETPLQHDFLSVYPELAQALFRVLKPGAKALITAGYRNIQFIGPMLEPPLRVCWTHVVRRKQAEKPLYPHIDSSSVLMSLVYREPWSMPKDLVQDADNDLESYSIVGLEVAIRYYLQHYTDQGDTVLHLQADPQLCFNLSSTMMESAKALNHARLIGIEGPSVKGSIL